MRVLALGSMYPPHHLGGYELVWRSAMRALRAAGHDARVLCSDLRLETAEPDEPDTHRELRWYWREHEFPRLGWRERIALERHNGDVLRRHLAEFAPDVVAWWAMGGMSLGLIERVRRAGLPAAGFVADDWLVYGPLVDGWLRPFRRATVGRARTPAAVAAAAGAALAERLTGLPARVDLDAAARWVLISETVRRGAREAGLRLPGSTIAHLGVDEAFLHPQAERPWRWRLLYVGRIDARKGIEDAVRALAELPAQATLTVAGDGDPAELARLIERSTQLGVRPRVQMLGMKSHDELPALYADADAVLFPVRWSEPWGIVPLEAMAFARPVLATGLGGSGEYLRDGENCLIVPPSDPAALAAALRRLQGDAELRARLREGGERTARTHTEGVFNRAVLQALLAAAN